MNVDQILLELNSAQVEYILIGGMNFLLRHHPELTFDVDIWVRDSDSNLSNLNRALRQLGAEWGPTEQSWRPVPQESDWLMRQPVFCLTTHFGALDVFREVRGLEGRYDECKKATVESRTAAGVPFSGLSDAHMLETQLALEPHEQKPSRIAALKRALGQ